MATEIGKAYVQIVPSAKGIGKQIESGSAGEISSAGEALGNNMGQKLVGTIKKVVLAIGIGKIISSS